MKALADEIRRHDHLYYVLDRPEISDEAYDRLWGELRRLEEAHPGLAEPDSPTQRVAGAPLPSLPSLRHVAPMLSLESVSRASDVRAFVARVAVAQGSAPRKLVAEPKLDGVSIEVVYENGRLVRAATRGDGVIGEDVTANVRTIRAVPLRLRDDAPAAPSTLSVRGEVLMTKEAFRALVAHPERAAEAAFANPPRERGEPGAERGGGSRDRSRARDVLPRAEEPRGGRGVPRARARARLGRTKGEGRAIRGQDREPPPGRKVSHGQRGRRTPAR